MPVATQINNFSFQMYLDKQEYIDRVISQGRFEPETTRWISDFLGKGDVFFDVGANVGFFTLIAASKVGVSGSVKAFEPTTYAMAKLKKNISLNKYDNIECYKYALSTENRCAVDISYNPSEYLSGSDGSMRSSWRADGSAQQGHIDFCDFVRLDDFLERHPVPKIDLIKIDVDGNELSVLGGAKTTISRYRPGIVLEILDPSRSKERYQGAGLDETTKTMSFLFDAGYRAESESGDELSNVSELLAFLREFDGSRGAPNFIFRIG